MLKSLSFCAVILGSMFAFQSCNKDANVPAPVASTFQEPATSNVSSIESIEEIFDDTEFGARASAAAPIDKANKVYQVFQVTGTYSTTGTNASASLAVNTDGSSAATLADSVVKSKNGWSAFSVKPEKFGTYLKKTVDKTKSQVYYMKDKDAKIWRKMIAVSAGGTTFSFLPNYYKSSVTFATSGGTSGSLD